MSRKPTLFTHAFTVGSILLLVFAILFVGLHFLQNYLEFRTNSQNLRKEYFESQQEKLAWEVHHFIELINTKQSNLAKESQIELETRANSAHTLLENLYKNYYQTMPKDEFTNLFVNVFRSLDSSNNSFEIFVVTPEFEELIKLPSAPSEASLLRQMYGYSQASSNGFYSYIKKSGSALEKRVAYLKNFKPLDLLIGVSSSPDTSKKQVQKELLSDIENLRFDLKGENYLFLGMWNGVALTPPSKGKNMLHIQDVNGKFIVKELIETAKSGGGFVEYVMPDLEGKRTQNKLSYVQGIPEWEWYVGAGIYTDDIDAQIEEKTKELHKNFFVSLITSMGLFLILTLTMGYFYRRLNAKIRADFTAFFEFFNSLAHFNYPIDKKELRFAEFETLALSANSMLEEKLTLERKLSHLAHPDHLTGLPNRALLSDRIHQSIKNAKRYDQQLALCFVDLDNFKKINDSFGHSYGDETLLQVATRIQNILRETDTLSRIGGDEFIILLEDIKNRENLAAIVTKILDSFKTAFNIHGQTFFLTASIGVSLYPSHGDNTETLLKNADTAMYKSKHIGKNTFSFYDPTMSKKALEMVAIENELKSAIKNNELEVFYQPQIDLNSNELVGVEALVRWNHPEQGLLFPGYFIPYAEESRMILPIGSFVLEQACKDYMRLKNACGFDGRVCVNVSGIQLEDENFLGKLAKILRHSAIPPTALELEITESIFMKDVTRWIEILKKIRSLGVKVAIDDFGTGYSSLNYLRRLPADKLKIDISFVRDLLHFEDAQAIAKAIIVLAKSLNMTTLAEGVECKDQADYLQKIGCDEAQGFLYEKAISFSDVADFIKDFRNNKKS
jgi:diguanylate cyclase (GGDEF)-like protein